MRKLSALVCAGALVVTSVVPAWAAGTQTSNPITGEGGLENMGANGVSIDSIVLPAVADGAYDFTLDPEKLLATYGGDAYDGSTLYFNAQDDPATLMGSNGTDKVYYQDKVVVTAAAEQQAAFAIDTDKSIKMAADDTYFVYVPDRSNEDAIQSAKGTWVTLTKANFATYFKVTVDDVDNPTTITKVEAKENKELTSDTVPNVFDGKMYKLGWKEVKGDLINKCVTVAADGTLTINDGVKLATSADATAYTAVTAVSALKYTAETRTNTNTSDEVKIVNKSSTAKTVRVKVNVANDDDILNFEAKDTGLDTTKASVSLKITGKTTKGTTDTTATPVYVAKTTEKVGEEDVNYYSAVLDLNVGGLDLSASNGPVTTYMAGKDDMTRGHVFNAFLSPVEDSEYESASFSLQGAAADVASMSTSTEPNKQAKAAAQKIWSDYAASLRSGSTVVSPSITVVYEIKDQVTKIVGTPTATTGEANWDGGYIWFGLADTVKAEEATDIQIVNKTGAIEDVYKVNTSDCYFDGSWMGIPSGQEAGEASSILVKMKDGKVYSQKLW